MGYFSDLDIERQDYEATTGDYSHDQEPDQQDYDAGYDEYKERKAGLFKETDKVVNEFFGYLNKITSEHKEDK